MSWLDRLTGRDAEPAPEPECPPDCVKCRESASIDPDSTPEEDR